MPREARRLCHFADAAGRSGRSVPAGIDAETAAAILFKGMTAEYLLHRTHTVRAGETILVHAAAGGVGLPLPVGQASRRPGHRHGGSDDKARAARDNGCDVPIVSADYRFADAVKAATSGRGVDVVFDGLGRLAERENYELLASTGHWISYGHATGALPPLDPGLQSAKSLRLSRPVLFHYTDDPVRLRAMAASVFAMLECGVLKVTLRHRFPLSAAAAALNSLQSRQTMGSIVLFA